MGNDSGIKIKDKWKAKYYKGLVQALQRKPKVL